MKPADLDALLHRARARDPDALSELVNAYNQRLYGLLFRLTGRRDLAEDLLQETFLRMVRTIGQYEHSGKFESWLFRIAANLARDHLRRYKRRGVALSLEDDRDDNPLSGSLPAGTPGPETCVDSDEAKQRLEAAVFELSDNDREIILLRHYSDLSFREIADMLALPLGTVLARGHRALRKLRERMETQGGAP